MLSSTRPRKARRAAAITAGVASLGLILAACGDGDAPADDVTDSTDVDTDAEGGDPVTLSISTFNNFGYTDELLQQYMDENPHVTINHVLAAEAGDARDNLSISLAAGGAGLADIEAVEVDWLAEFLTYSDHFEELPAIDGRWLDWKVDQATTPDGKIIGYGTDIGPMAICFRSDLLEEAGLPSEREELAEYLGGEDATWESYFEVGQEYVDATGDGWFDSAEAIYQGMVNQLDAAYEDPATGEVKDLDSNAEVRALYDSVVDAVDAGLSASVSQWGDDWSAGFQNGAFATMLCPSWMTGPIEQNAGNIDAWDVADVFPNGGGNWGGSFLTVPSAGENTEEAIKLAAWLTSAEVQTQAFENAGTFPSQVEAQESEAVQTFVNDFMSEAPVGEIFSERANALTVAPFKGENYFIVNGEIQDAIERVEQTGGERDASWDEAVSQVNAQVG